MIRTFHAKVDKAVLVGGLLPGTVLTVCFFWVRMPLPALFFMLLMIGAVERLIHTSYILDDDGRLIIHKGRFSRSRVLRVVEISKVELHRVPAFFWLLKREDVVLVTGSDGKEWILSPLAAAEFCHVLLKKKEE
uniref:PH domain-containing protein n=1 Tax=Bacteroides acidifaciens TaxID=85831 RepID=UPI00258BB8A3